MMEEQWESNIQPIESETVFEPIKSKNNTSYEEEKAAEEFVDGLPDWDLEPPYELVRRVNRN